MKLYTSTYRTYRGDKGVAISLGLPLSPVPYKDIAMLKPESNEFRKLAAVRHLANSSKRKRDVQNVFAEKYLLRLNNLGIDKVLSVLDDGDVLLCFCWPGDFCHRHILADWLRSHGVFIEELGGPVHEM